MAICQYCQRQNKDGVKFCAGCGRLMLQASVPDKNPQDYPAGQAPLAAEQAPKKSHETGLFLSLAALVALLIAAAVIFLPKLFASGTPEQGSEADTLSDTQMSDTSVDAADASQPELLSSYSFSNDRAWIRLEDDGTTYYASIDKNGNEIFRMSDYSILFVTDYSEDYAYVHTNDDIVRAIDKSGNVLYSLKEEDSGEVLAYGGGYALCRRHGGDAGSSEDVYVFYDPSGASWEEDIESVNVYGPYYCGCGVFWVDHDAPLYNAKRQQWISLDASVHYNCKVQFDEGTAGLLCYGGVLGTDRLSVTTLSEDGSFQHHPFVIDSGYDVYCTTLHDGFMVYTIDFENFYSFDAASGKSYLLDPAYASQLSFYGGPSPACMDTDDPECGFRNGRIAVTMYGEDGGTYVAVFDTKWIMKMKPTEYDSLYGFDGNRLVVEKDGKLAVYDANGKQLFTASQLGVSSISAYADGVAYIGTGKYIDEDGNLLFDRITYLPAD